MMSGPIPRLQQEHPGPSNQGKTESKPSLAELYDLVLVAALCHAGAQPAVCVAVFRTGEQASPVVDPLPPVPP